jgi:hypothetical protein
MNRKTCNAVEENKATVYSNTFEMISKEIIYNF